jgi:hypothetical protein
MWGIAGIAPLILNLGNRRRWITRLTHRLLFPRRSGPILNVKLRGPYRRSEHCLSRKSNHDYSVVQAIAQALHGLSCSDSHHCSSKDKILRGRVFALWAWVFLGVKRPGHEPDYLSPLSTEVKNGWSYTSARLLCPHVVHKATLQLLYWRE